MPGRVQVSWGFWLPDSSSSCVRSVQHTARPFRDSSSIPSQKAAPCYIVLVLKGGDRNCYKRLLQMRIGIGFCCGGLVFPCSAQWELQALKEADFCQKTVSAHNFEQHSVCSPHIYCIHYRLLNSHHRKETCTIVLLVITESKNKLFPVMLLSSLFYSVSVNQIHICLKLSGVQKQVCSKLNILTKEKRFISIKNVFLE